MGSHIGRKSKLCIEMRETNHESRHEYKLDFTIPNKNQLIFGAKSQRFYPPLIWNILPYHNKCAENLNFFKEVITVGDQIKTKNKTYND